ncbi:MAG: hypothetical protein DRP65_04700 [Planctomycetota bacterium]|nr:MAG: hypothetical protein DRP65_04700 [Planctomycetota bacterium]
MSEKGGKYTKHEPPIFYNIEQDPGERYNTTSECPDALTRIQKIVDERQKTFH